MNDRDPTVRLRQALLDGRFFPNERLVEADLVARFGGTRASVRQALAVLEQQGLVVRERNRGARVRLVREREAVEIVEIRARLEALTARHAAEHATPEDIGRLEAMLRAMEAQAAAHDLTGYAASNVAFHAEITRLADLPTTARMLDALHFQTVAFQFRPLFEPGRAAEVDAEHRALVAAIASGDGDAAEHAMRHHIDNVKRALAAAIVARRLERGPLLGADDQSADATTQV